MIRRMPLRTAQDRACQLRALVATSPSPSLRRAAAEALARLYVAAPTGSPAEPAVGHAAARQRVSES